MILTPEQRSVLEQITEDVDADIDEMIEVLDIRKEKEKEFKI